MQHELVGIMLAALKNGVGLAVKSNDPDSLRRDFYVARKKAQEPEFDRLSFHISHLDSMELWLVVNPDGAPTSGPARIRKDPVNA